MVLRIQEPRTTAESRCIVNAVGDTRRTAGLAQTDMHVSRPIVRAQRYDSISKMVSISTGTSLGSACRPTAERACLPFSPKTSKYSSLAP